MRAEYDFSGGIRGKHDEAYRQGTNLILLEPDVAGVFKDSATINSALRTQSQHCPETCVNTNRGLNQRPFSPQSSPLGDDSASFPA